jgi:DNA repair protein RadC
MGIIKAKEVKGKKVPGIELMYTSTRLTSKRPVVCNVADAYNLFLQHWDKSKFELIEQFKVLLLNQANIVIGIFELSSGGITSTVADLRIMFAAALLTGSSSVVLCHNHPSSSTEPSEADKVLTRKIRAAGRLMDIKILDHLIISKKGCFSFYEKGLL